MARYRELLRQAETTRPVVSLRQFGGLRAAYLASPEFSDLAATTRKHYSLRLRQLEDVIGIEMRLDIIDRQVVRALRSKFSDRPRTANDVVGVLRLLFNFAIDELDLLEFNPAARIKKLKTGEGYDPWLDWAIEQFRRRAPEHMVMFLELALHTGQRKGDCLRMAKTDYDGRAIRVVQQKTGRRLWIPCHLDLKNKLDEWLARQTDAVTILTTITGRAWTKDNFNRRWREATGTASLNGTGLVPHGLRYNATQNLFEPGCTTEQAKAITGHRTDAMVAKYGKGAEQKRLAQEAIWKLEQNEAEPKV